MTSSKLLAPLLVVTFLISSVLMAHLDLQQDNTSAGKTSQIDLESKIDDGSARNSKRNESDTAEIYESYNDTTTFTCYGKKTGYYADIKLACRVYHFCTQMDSMGNTTYQRTSYICLENSIFDQRDLNCVGESQLMVPCDKAEEEYDSSNKQFDIQEDQPSMSDNLAANIMMNPITRFIAG